MPENESLHYDARVASRWRPIAERLDGGESPAELFRDMECEFYAFGKKVWKQWKEREIDPDSLLKAALNDPKALDDLIRRARNDPFARLLREIAADLQEPNMAILISRFADELWAVAENEHLQLDRRQGGQSPQFMTQVQQMLSRVVRALLNNTTRFPSQPARDEPPPDLESQLGKSLL